MRRPFTRPWSSRWLRRNELGQKNGRHDAREWGIRLRPNLTVLLVLHAILLASENCLGEVRQATCYSRHVGRPISLKVYTPIDYRKSNWRYPVVYALCGDTKDADRQCSLMSSAVNAGLGSQAIKPLIYVQVGGLQSRVEGATCDQSLRIANALAYEIVPFVDKNYRTIASHEGRALAGFGRGGSIAFQIAFRFPFLFSSVVCFEGAFCRAPAVGPGLTASPGAERCSDEARSLQALMEANAEQIREHLRLLVVSAGDDAERFTNCQKLAERAGALKMRLTSLSVPEVRSDRAGFIEKFVLESFRFIQEGLRAPASATEGLVHDAFYWSRLNRQNVWVKVYTPPGYEKSSRRYPVVYNLHGAGGGTPQRQWLRAGATLKEAIQSRQVRPMIFVFVNGLGDTFFLDYQDGSLKVESMVVHELIPWIDRRYRTIASREGRAIEGFSMGGASALRLALKYPELFAAVVSYGAALVSGTELAERNPRLGSKEYLEQNSPWTLARQNAWRVRGQLHIRMVCGEEDRLYQANVQFKDLLEALGIRVDWVPVPGVAHDTKGLYQRVGEESLRFIEAAFNSRHR